MPTPNQDLGIDIGITAASIALAGPTGGISLLAPIIWGAIRSKQANNAAGEAALQWAQSENDIAQFNARMAGIRAEDARLRGEWEAKQIRIGSQLLIGEQRAGFAAQNVDVGIGSPVDVNADTAYLAELDAQMALANAAREAWGYRVDAANYQLHGKQALLAGAQQQTAYQYAGNQAVLSAASSATSLLAQKYGWGMPKKPKTPEPTAPPKPGAPPVPPPQVTPAPIRPSLRRKDVP